MLETLSLMPHKSVIFLNLKLGLTLGLSLTLFDMLTAYAQRKLHIPSLFTSQYLGLLAAIGSAMVGTYLCFLSLFAPDYATRSELYNGSIEEIGYGFAIALVLIGLFAVSLPTQIILSNLEKHRNASGKH